MPSLDVTSSSYFLNYYFKWISPILSQAEVEGLFSWVNSVLLDIGAAPLLNISHLSMVPLSEDNAPLDSLLIYFPLSFSDPEQAERFRLSVWEKYHSEITITPYAFSFVSQQVAQTKKKLCVFDMDSTLIDQEVIDELARVKGIHDEIALITESAMRGELDFTQSLQRRVLLLKGMAWYEAQAIIPHLTVSAGGEALLQNLRQQQIKTAIVSGGFEFVLKHFEKQLFLDQVYGHKLILDDDELLTGEVEAPIVDAAYKQKLVHQLKQNYQVDLNETVVVGDGANDIPMISEAGISVSFAGKPKLSAVANTLILHRNLLWLKHLL